MLFSLLKHYLDTDTALKDFPRLWGTGISDAILKFYSGPDQKKSYFRQNVLKFCLPNLITPLYPVK